MSTHLIRLPDIGEGITEAEIVEWQVSVGDRISEDQIIGSVMTDKAAVEIPSPVAGIVEVLSGSVGDVLSVGGDYARIRTSSESFADAVPDEFSDADVAADEIPDATPVEAEVTDRQDDPPLSSSAPASSEHIPDDALKQPVAQAEASPAWQAPLSKPSASPSVRRSAYRNGVSLDEVQGSGPHGRIAHEDIERHLAQLASTTRSQDSQRNRPTTATDSTGKIEHIKVVGMRRAIARKMQTAKQHIPHFSYIEEMDVTRLEGLREQLNEQAGERHARLSVLPFIMLAMLRSVQAFPNMNARYDDEAEIIAQYQDVHMGIAIQTERGLMVPVLKAAQRLDIRSLAAGVSELAEAARQGTLAATGRVSGTITLTSLGALGGLASTPVINYPEVAIVGVNRIVTRPMFQDDVVVARRLMNLSCSFDHRVIDGHDAARFVQCIKGYLEFPESLFIAVR